jgi:hypothetical protein
MLEKVICLFERLVVAQEKIAENQAAYLEFQKENMVENVYVAAPEAPKTEEKPKATRAKKEKATEPVEAPKAEEPKKEKPAKPKLTLADVKAAVAGYAEARMKGGSADPKGDARALMAHHGGGAKKTDEIAEEYWEGVVEACKSGWEPLPAKDEEL